MPEHFTYYDLEIRYGVMAYWYLSQIEKAAGIISQNIIADFESRLAHAIRVQDNLAQRRKVA